MMSDATEGAHEFLLRQAKQREQERASIWRQTFEPKPGHGLESTKNSPNNYGKLSDAQVDRMKNESWVVEVKNGSMFFTKQQLLKLALMDCPSAVENPIPIGGHADESETAAFPESTAASALDTQVGGDHYKTMGEFQPWNVLRAWLTPEEFRGYMKGTAIAYLARERQKGGDQDVSKAAHTLHGLIEMMGAK